MEFNKANFYRKNLHPEIQKIHNSSTSKNTFHKRLFKNHIENTIQNLDLTKLKDLRDYTVTIRDFRGKQLSKLATLYRNLPKKEQESQEKMFKNRPGSTPELMTYFVKEWSLNNDVLKIIDSKIRKLSSDLRKQQNLLKATNSRKSSILKNCIARVDASPFGNKYIQACQKKTIRIQYRTRRTTKVETSPITQVEIQKQTTTKNHNRNNPSTSTSCVKTAVTLQQRKQALHKKQKADRERGHKAVIDRTIQAERLNPHYHYPDV